MAVEECENDFLDGCVHTRLFLKATLEPTKMSEFDRKSLRGHQDVSGRNRIEVSGRVHKGVSTSQSDKEAHIEKKTSKTYHQRDCL